MVCPELVVPIAINEEVIEVRCCTTGAKDNTPCIAAENGHLHFKSKIAKVQRRGQAGMKCSIQRDDTMITASRECTISLVSDSLLPIVPLTIINQRIIQGKCSHIGRI